MEELQDQLLADASEIVDTLVADISDLRIARLQGRRRRELAARIFRHVHTLKGTARSLEIESLASVAHEFEAVLDGLRLGRIELTNDLLDLFENATEAIAQALKRTTKKSESAAKSLIKRLADVAATGKKQAFIADSLRSTLPQGIARALSEYDLQHAREAIREGGHLFIVNARFSIDDFDEGFRQLTKLLGESGEVIATVPGASVTADELQFRLLYAAEIIPAHTIRRVSNLGEIDINRLAIVPGPTSKPIEPTTPAVFQVEAQRASSVEVNLSQIENLISELRDLFRESCNAVLSVAPPSNRDSTDTAIAALQRQFSTVEETLIKLRLVPCAEMLERVATRSGRIAARQLGKQVEFEIEGGDVGIDKSLADIVVDPLSHLVNNAITHGIEGHEERVAAGKNATGKIKLQASSKGSRVHISVSDDGRGIDVPRIAAAACAQGIVKTPEDLGADQCLRLIFRPGFSTSVEVDEMSGRGIGLEIVDRAMEQTGGEVRLATESGLGTTFVMMLPAALSLMPCVIVRLGEQSYGIASARVGGMRSLDAVELETVEKQNTLEWAGEILPVIPMRNLLAQATGSGHDRGASAVLWQSAGRVNDLSDGSGRCAIIVDAILGQHETLVRGLGRHAARWAGVFGAAELWDGNVALVLDVDELIKSWSPMPQA